MKNILNTRIIQLKRKNSLLKCCFNLAQIMSQNLIKHYGGRKFYTGDTESDYAATLGNSFKFVYAKYGYGNSFTLNKDSIVLESFNEFKQYI